MKGFVSMLHQFGGPKDPWLWNKIKTITVHFFMINLCGWWMKVKLLVLVQDLLVRGTMCIIAPPTCTKMWELFSCTNTNMEVRTIFIVKSVSPHWDFSSNKKKNSFLKTTWHEDSKDIANTTHHQSRHLCLTRIH